MAGLEKIAGQMKHAGKESNWEGPELAPGPHTLEFDFAYAGMGPGTLAFDSSAGNGQGGTGVL